MKKLIKFLLLLAVLYFDICVINYLSCIHTIENVEGTDSSIEYALYNHGYINTEWYKEITVAEFILAPIQRPKVTHE